MEVTTGRLDGLPDDLSIDGQAGELHGVTRRDVAPLGRTISLNRVVRHERIHESSKRDDSDAAVIADYYLFLVRKAHLRARLTDRLRGHDPRGFVCVDHVGRTSRRFSGGPPGAASC